MIDQILFCRGCVSTEVNDVLELQSIPIGDCFSVNTLTHSTLFLSQAAWIGIE